MARGLEVSQAAASVEDRSRGVTMRSMGHKPMRTSPVRAESVRNGQLDRPQKRKLTPPSPHFLECVCFMQISIWELNMEELCICIWDLWLGKMQQRLEKPKVKKEIRAIGGDSRIGGIVLLVFVGLSRTCFFITCKTKPAENQTNKQTNKQTDLEGRAPRSGRLGLCFWVVVFSSLLCMLSVSGICARASVIKGACVVHI